MSKKGKKDSENKREGSRFFKVCYTLFAWLVRLLFRIKVIGRENEPSHGKYIVCANHTAASDVVVICYAFKKHQIRFMAKKELFKIPLLAQLIRALGAYPIDRSGKDIGAIKNALSILEDGKCTGIFPQGHRYPGVNPRETKAKNGASLICAKTSSDVVPVYIYRKNNIPGIFRKTYVIIGEKIPFESFEYNPEASGEYARMTDIIFDRICTLGEAFSEELESKKKAK